MSQGKPERNSEPAAKVEVLLSAPVQNAGLNVSGFVVDGRLVKGMQCKHDNVVYTVLRESIFGEELKTPGGSRGRSVSCLLGTTDPLRSIAEKTVLIFFTVPGGGGGAGGGGGGSSGPAIPNSEGKSSDISPKSNDEPPER